MEELDPIISNFLLSTVSEDKYLNYVSIFNSLKGFNESDFWRSGFETGEIMSRLLTIMADKDDQYDAIMAMDREVIMYVNSTLTIEGVELSNDNGIFITARLLEALLIVANVEEGLENPIIAACESLSNDRTYEFAKALNAYGTLSVTEYHEGIEDITDEFLNRLRRHYYNRSDVENDDSSEESIIDYANFISDLNRRYKLEEMHFDKEILIKLCNSYKDSWNKNSDYSINPLLTLTELISFIENYINSKGKLWIRSYPYDFAVLALMLAKDTNVDKDTLVQHAYDCGLYRLTRLTADIECAEELEDDKDVLELTRLESKKKEICGLLVESFKQLKR